MSYALIVVHSDIPFDDKNILRLIVDYLLSRKSIDQFLFNYCAYKKFFVNKREFVKKMKANSGVLDEEDIMDFLSETQKIKEKIKLHKDLYSFL